MGVSLIPSLVTGFSMLLELKIADRDIAFKSRATTELLGASFASSAVRSQLS